MNTALVSVCLQNLASPNGSGAVPATSVASRSIAPLVGMSTSSKVEREKVCVIALLSDMPRCWITGHEAVLTGDRQMSRSSSL